MANLTSILTNVSSNKPFDSKLTKDYVSEDYLITWGSIPLQAYKDVFINCKFDRDAVSARQGIDGNVGYTAKPSPMLTIAVSLEAMSETNPFLWEVVRNQHDNNQPFIESLVIKDRVSGQMLTGLNAILQTPSDFTLGKQHTDIERTWIFKASKAKIGNSIY